MTLILDLPPEVESRLRGEAERNGQPAEEYVLRLIDQSLPEKLTKKQHALIAMLDAWDKEDETDDPAEIAARQADWEEFKEAINRHHEGIRVIYP